MRNDVVGSTDEHDRRLLSYVHPPGWQNPEPARRYDLVVIGGGTAGLVCAAGAAGLGARVALVERARLGGDCLNSGCVPSKTLLRSARAVREARAGAAVGVSAPPVVDFDAVMRRVRERRADLAPHDSAERFTSLGVDVFFGDAQFADRGSVNVGDARLRFRRAVIATGSRPAMPPIDGLASVRCFTSDTIFSLTAQPQSMLVIGGGAVGCELAQAFALLGTAVTLVEAGDRLLPQVDADASAIVTSALEQAGVRVLLGRADVGGLLTSADVVLVATGRTPNVDGLGLAAAGVAAGRAGVEVNDRLQTSNPGIFAAGDVCSPHRFTHAADAMARIVIQNALFYGRKQVSDLIIPSCIYTFPEVAHVGADTGADTDGVPGADNVVTIRLADVDRSVIDDETDGFVRVRHSRGTIAGATIVAPHAGDLIGHVAHLMSNSGTLGDLSATIFPYPTVAEALRKAGDTHRRSALTPAARAILGRYFSLLRR